MPSGTLGFSTSSSSSTTETIKDTTDHFFTYTSFRNQYREIYIEYNDYDLLPVGAIDGVGNKRTAHNNYAHLQPELMTDPNNNRTQVLRSPLGQ